MLKSFVQKAAEVAILPYWAEYEVLAHILGRIPACHTVSEQAAPWTGALGIYLRRALFRHMIAMIGNDVSIRTGSILTKPTIEIGNAVYVGYGCILGDVRIGNDTLVADHVRIVSGQHGIAPNLPIKDQPDTFRPIRIGCDCWIGTAAIIMDDLGDHCVVGAGSVVTKPVSEYAIVAGNPARLIGDRRERTPTVP